MARPGSESVGDSELKQISNDLGSDMAIIAEAFRIKERNGVGD